MRTIIDFDELFRIFGIEPGISDTQLAVRALMRKAKTARNDLTLFYSMVMKHELTKARLDPAPHQKLMFSFIQHHDRSVLRMPIGTGKTFGMVATTLWLLGSDTTQRGAIVSKIRQQAQKPLGMVADYVTEPKLNSALILIYPWLKKSGRPADTWTQNQLTVERDPGIRDPSLLAVGIDAAIAGARLSWLVADDTIDDENTNTPANREKVASNFDGRLMSRLDPIGSRAVVCNTPWHRKDLTYHLEYNAGWPTITMDIYGFIRINNAEASWLDEALGTMIRKSTTRNGYYRLSEFDPDPNEETPLWPERYSAERIHEIRYGREGRGGMLPHEFARLFLCEPFDESAARCQKDWIEACKLQGMGTNLVKEYNGNSPVYTGLDLGIGSSMKHDKTVFFTFELLPDGKRRILDIESGRWTGPVIVDKIIHKTEVYNSMLIVESNSAQDYIRQFAIKKRKDLMIKAHTTTRANKLHLDFGVESVFTEVQQKAWIIPCDKYGVCEPEVQNWIDDMLYYQPPPAHTGDHLMACWIARDRARKSNKNDPVPTAGAQLQMSQTGGF